MAIKYNEIQELLRRRADLHARLNLMPYDGTPEIKERGDGKYLYVRKRVAGKLTSTYVGVYTEELYNLLLRNAREAREIRKLLRNIEKQLAAAGYSEDELSADIINNIAFEEDVREKKYRSNLAANSLLLFTDIGYRFAKFMTVFMMIVSVFMVFYSVVVYLTANPVVGWTTTILFLSVAFFGLFGILTIIIKYLQLLVDLVFKRKQYSFESIEKLTK